jgi:hypothetical protein
MNEPLSLFIQVYKQHHNVELCIAELKRKGFSKHETVKVLLQVTDISSSQAEELVRCSLAWSV